MDPEYHLGLRTETDKSKIYPKKKGGAAARAANTPAVDQDEPTPAPAPEPETPSKIEPVVEIPRRAPSGTGRRQVDTERAVSPVSSGSSSASESPLIQKMKLNGTGHSKSDSTTPMPPPATDDMSPPHPGPSDRPTSPVQTTGVRSHLCPIYRRERSLMCPPFIGPAARYADRCTCCDEREISRRQV